MVESAHILYCVIRLIRGMTRQLRGETSAFSTELKDKILARTKGQESLSNANVCCTLLATGWDHSPHPIIRTECIPVMLWWKHYLALHFFLSGHCNFITGQKYNNSISDRVQLSTSLTQLAIKNFPPCICSSSGGMVHILITLAKHAYIETTISITS